MHTVWAKPRPGSGRNGANLTFPLVCEAFRKIACSVRSPKARLSSSEGQPHITHIRSSYRRQISRSDYPWPELEMDPCSALLYHTWRAQWAPRPRQRSPRPTRARPTAALHGARPSGSAAHRPVHDTRGPHDRRIVSSKKSAANNDLVPTFTGSHRPKFAIAGRSSHAYRIMSYVGRRRVSIFQCSAKL